MLAAPVSDAELARLQSDAQARAAVSTPASGVAAIADVLPPAASVSEDGRPERVPPPRLLEADVGTLKRVVDTYGWLKLAYEKIRERIPAPNQIRRALFE